MALLFTLVNGIFSAVVNATVFAGASAGFRMLRNDGGKERKRHDFAEEQLQRARDEFNENRMKRLDFINKRLREQNKGRAYIHDTHEAMLEYYRVFRKKIKPLPPEPQLSDFYHPSEEQENSEPLFVTVGTGIATYALYKYLK